MKTNTKIIFTFLFIFIAFLLNSFTLNFYKISGIRTIPYSIMAILYGIFGVIIYGWYKKLKEDKDER